MRKSTQLRLASLFALLISLSLLNNVEHGVASTATTPTYKFDFEGNFSPAIGSATLGASAACVGWSCTASTSWGTSGGDGYWAWNTASGSGPGLNLTNFSISDTYTIILKFSVSQLTSYTRILNMNEGDTGLYLLSGKIYYYNAITASAPIYAANDVITMALTRTPQDITLFTSDSSTATTTQRFQYSSSGLARLSTQSNLLFFTDDGGEFAPSGKFFSLAIWNDRALSSTEINSFLYTPLVPTLNFSTSPVSAIYRTLTAISTTTNLPGRATFYSNGKRIAGCINVAASGSNGTYSVGCNWKPAIKGTTLLRVIFTPTDSSYSPLTLNKSIVVNPRTSTR